MSESERNRTIFEQLSFRVRIWLDRQTPPDSLVLVLSALVVGIGGGLGAVLFVWLLRQVSDVTRWLITNPLGAPLFIFFDLVIFLPYPDVRLKC